MIISGRARATVLLFVCLLGAALLCPGESAAFVERPAASDLSRRTFVSPVLRPAPRHADAAALAPDAARDRDRLLAGEGAGWVTIADAATGRAALLEGRGLVRFPAGTSGAHGARAVLTAADAREGARGFLARYPSLLGAGAGQPVDRPEAGFADGDFVVAAFGWELGGVPVENAHLVFRYRAGVLVQAGQENLSPALAGLDPRPSVDVRAAWETAWAHAGGRTSEDRVLGTRLLIVPVADGTRLGYRLVHVLTFAREGVTGTWEARIDAHAGTLLAFRDVNAYGRAHGGVYVADQPSPEVDRPLPHVDIGGGSYADASGRFVGDTATSTLDGRYVRISDACGAIDLSTTNGDLDFGTSPGPDCAVSGIGGAGNTRAARTQAYQIDEAKARVRAYLPGNVWLDGALFDEVNIAQTCNAYWSPIAGSINFYRSGDGCGNTGELPGVSLHEFAHGLDTHDGNGFSPDEGTGEAYGDITAAMFTHASCGGAGFFGTRNCTGYGDACVTCTGVREMDWDKRANHLPITPARLGDGQGLECRIDASYAGPCGYEGHCESYVVSEALWDLAARDLPATGMDQATAWQLVDRLWFSTRPTATAAYACPTPATADGCGAGSLFNVFRAADDADGDLSNGTPHAAAIYAAFARHGIACTAVVNTDQPNACPALVAPVVTGVPANDSVSLSWDPVPGATGYLVLRNDDGCDAGLTRLGTTTATVYVDNEPVNGVPYFYRVQALGGSEACASPVSTCVPATPVACRGAFALDQGVYNCSDVVGITLLDAGLVGAGTKTVTVRSSLEPTPETVLLTETPAGSGRFTGTIATTLSIAAGDGAIGVSDGATITLRYEDADACGAGPETVERSVGVDCVAPAITNFTVAATDIGATVTWTTNEPATSRVTWGATKPPVTVIEDGRLVTSHTIELTGLAACTTYYLVAGGSDAAGNTTSNDGNGTYSPFVTGGRGYLLRDDVESGPGGFTVQTNQGSSFHIDTCRAKSAGHAWKAGAPVGTCPGTYAGNTGTSLISSTVDLGALGHGYHLRFQEWGSTEMDSYGTLRDTCTVQISTDGGTSWANLQPPYGGSSNGWFLNDIDLAAYQGPVRFRFVFQSDFDWNYEGWYLDDIEVSRVVTCAPELHYQANTIADVCGGTGFGGDGVADPGEHVRLPLTLVNRGPAGASGLSATVSTTHPKATVTSARAAFPAIAPLGTTSSAVPHVAVRLAGDVACGTKVPIQLHVTGEQGSWDDSFELTVGSQAPGTPVNELEQHFDTGGALPAGWATQRITGNTWNVPGFAVYNCASSTGFYLRYPTSTSAAANSWAYTKALNLQAGVTYTLRFKQRVGFAGTFDLGENLGVYIGNAQSNTAMTTELWKQSGLKNSNCIERTVNFTVPANGTYYIGFWCFSNPSATDLTVDDVFVSYAPTVCTTRPCTGSTLAAPPEVNLLAWAPGSTASLSWQAAAGADAYRVYEGRTEDLPALAGTAVDSCERWSGAATTTGPAITRAPHAGHALWYLVAGVNAAGEGGAGPNRHVDATGVCP